MTEDELLLNYIRVRVTTSRIFIEVKNVESGAQEPMAARWSLASALPRQSTPAQVGRARLLALADYRYFRVCDACGGRHPAGHVRSREDGTDVCARCDV